MGTYHNFDKFLTSELGLMHLCPVPERPFGKKLKRSSDWWNKKRDEFLHDDGGVNQSESLTAGSFSRCNIAPPPVQDVPEGFTGTGAILHLCISVELFDEGS